MPESMSQMTRDMMKRHENKIKLFSWAVVESIASFIYPEYLINMEAKERPKHHVLVPPIKSVEQILRSDSELSKKLSIELIDRVLNLINHSTDETISVETIPEFVIFHGNNAEVLKVIFDLSIMNDVRRIIPATITKKFQLDVQQSDIMQSSDKSIFGHGEMSDTNKLDMYVDYIARETFLKLMITAPTIERSSRVPDDPTDVIINAEEVIVIDNQAAAICPICVNPAMIGQLPKLVSRIGIVSNTAFVDRCTSEDVAYRVQSNPLNKLVVYGYFRKRTTDEQ